MDFALSPAAQDACDRMWDFMRECVLPAEPVYQQWRAANGEHEYPPVMEELKAEARRRGLWNLFLPSLSGLSNVDYASVAEITGWSPVIAPEAINCQAPDTGNMETLHLFATPEQQKEWLEPLLEGTVRSAFAMTEPDVASSDATNIATRIEPDGDDYVINGRKWWISGTADERCRVFIVMGKSAPSAPAHRQQSMILVPRDTPGMTIVRHLPIFGYQDQHGHSEIVFDNVRVPAANLLAGEGDGFMIAQARLGPGRIHHAMRAIGMAERALSLMVGRAKSRAAFGGPLIDQGVVQDLIARSRIEIEQARLLVLKTAWLIDSRGARGARTEIAAIKVAAPAVATAVIDRAIEVFGGAGVSDDFPLAYFYAWARVLRIVDGPDAVHRRSVAREEIKRVSPLNAGLSEDGAGVEGDPDPGDAAVLDMAPVHHRQRPGTVRAQLEPGNDVRPVHPALDHLNVAGHGEHAAQALECLLDTVSRAHRPDEVDVRMEQGPHAVDVIGCPGLEVGGCHVFRRCGSPCCLRHGFAPRCSGGCLRRLPRPAGRKRSAPRAGPRRSSF
jgi:acyl-CoA dehydrogenase